MPRKSKLDQRIERIEAQLEKDRAELKYWQDARAVFAKEQAKQELAAIKGLSYQDRGTTKNPITGENFVDANLALRLGVREAMLQGVIDGTVPPDYVIPPTEPELTAALKVRIAERTLSSILPPDEDDSIWDYQLNEE